MTTTKLYHDLGHIANIINLFQTESVCAHTSCEHCLMYDSELAETERTACFLNALCEDLETLRDEEYKNIWKQSTPDL